MERKKKAVFLIAIDLFIILSTVLCLISFLKGSGNAGGTRCLRYYTVLSNLFMALSCTISLKSHIDMIRKVNKPSRFVELIKLSATSSVMLTCLTVVLFLSAYLGVKESFGNENLYYHLINPILAFLGTAFIEEKFDTGKESFIFASIPTFLYGIFYFIMVVIIGEEGGGWPDFYGFNRGGLWPVSLIAMFAAILIICYVLYRLRKGTVKGHGGKNE